MNKLVAWVSIIIFGVAAAYLLIQRNHTIQPQYTVYFQSQTYSITYPKGWLREGGDQKSGFEILSLSNYDYRNVTNPDGEFQPGRIKIALSIIDKGSKSLTQIVAEQFTGTETEFKKEKLNINGCQAIRVSAKFETGAGLFPRIETYIDYKDNQYAMLVGYYNGDNGSAEIINQIHESFKVLK